MFVTKKLFSLSPSAKLLKNVIEGHTLHSVRGVSQSFNYEDIFKFYSDAPAPAATPLTERDYERFISKRSALRQPGLTRQISLSQLSQGGVSMGGFGAGSLPQLAADLAPSLPISSVGSGQPYQGHYPLNSLGDTMMSYCNNMSAAQQSLEGSPTPPHLAHQTNNGSPNNAGNNGTGNGDCEEEGWRGHSIAALRRRASELSAAIPPYLQLNYDAHSPVY